MQGLGIDILYMDKYRNMDTTVDFSNFCCGMITTKRFQTANRQLFNSNNSDIFLIFPNLKYIYVK